MCKSHLRLLWIVTPNTLWASTGSRALVSMAKADGRWPTTLRKRKVISLHFLWLRTILFVAAQVLMLSSSDCKIDTPRAAANPGSQVETVCPSLTHCHQSVTKAQYVTCYSKERFFFSCWYSFRTIWLRSFRGESQLMRLHFENNIFVVSRSSDRARLFTFNHLGLLFVSWLISRGGKKKEQF